MNITSLATAHADHAADLARAVDHALTDPHSPGIIDAREAPPIARLVALVAGGAQVVNQTQREAVSWLRGRRFARDLADDARDLHLPPAA